MIFDASPSGIPPTVLAAVGLLIAYVVGGVIYRLYFHPLAKFPGPRLAAATLWYEFYYDCILFGQYTFRIKEMHDQYGKSLKCRSKILASHG